jgi:hypothetical protein
MFGSSKLLTRTESKDQTSYIAAEKSPACVMLQQDKIT